MALPPPSAPIEQFYANVATSIQTTWGGEAFWGSIALVAIVISFLFVAIAYMLSELLRSPELQAWAKNELVESAMSAVMVGLIFSSLTVLNTLVAAMTGGYSHIGVGYSYLNETLNDLSRVYIHLLLLDATIGTLGTLGASLFLPFFGLPAGITVFGVGLNPLPGLSMVNGAIVNVADATALVIINLLAQTMLLEFIYEQFFTFFLPFGVILRTFNMTRRLGSTIIALAITGYVVYPLTLVLNKGIYDYDLNYVAQYSATADIPPEWKITSDQLASIRRISIVSPLEAVDEGTDFNLTFIANTPNGTYSIYYRDAAGTQDFTWLADGGYQERVPVVYTVYNAQEGEWEYRVNVSFINATPCNEGCPIGVLPDGTAYGGCDAARGFCMESAVASLNVSVQPVCEWYEIFCETKKEFNRAGYILGHISSLGLVMVGGLAGSPLLSVLGAAGSGNFGMLSPTYYAFTAYDYVTCDANTAQQPCSSCGSSIPSWCPNAGLISNPAGILVPPEWALPIVVRKLFLITVLTVVDIIIAITFFRSLSASIGGETQLAGMTKLV